MKTTIFTFAALVIFSLSAHASTADEMKTVLTCHPVQVFPDTGMELKLTQGGYAGLTMVQVTRFFLGHTSSENFVVTKVNQANPPLVGAPQVYQGNGISFSVNYTTAPMQDGGHYATLQLDQGTSVSNEALDCR